MAVFASIGASIFGAGTFLAGITAAALQTAAGIGMSLVAQSLAGQPKTRARAFSTQVTLRSGDDQPRAINLGWNVTGGTLVYANSWGEANAYMTQVVALGDMPVREFTRIIVDGSLASFLADEGDPDLGWPVAEFRKAGRDHLWIKFYDGTQTAADPFLTGTVATTERPWPSNRIGRGIPYAIVTARAPERADGEEQPLFSGFPSFKFETRGLRLYDLTDPAQDPDDPSTWGGGDGDFLPAVQAYNILRGLSFAGQWVYGLQGLAPARLPEDNWIAAINKCREQVQTDPDAPTETRYQSGGELTVDTPIADALESLMSACQGRIAESGGQYLCFVGEPGEPVYSFTDGDILSSEEQSFTPFFSLADSINGVAATWPNPAEAWATKTAPPRYRTDLEALDGGRRLMASVDLAMVPWGGQVQRLMVSALREAQRARRHTLSLGPEAWPLQPGDIVEWTSGRNGYESKQFRVDGVADRANLDIMLDLTEVDPADYDWNPSTDFEPIINGPAGIVGPPPLLMQGWQALPAIIYDDQGRPRRPSVEVRFASGLSDVYSVRVQVRAEGEELPFFDGEVPYGPPYSVVLAGQFPPDSDLEVRGIFVRDSGQESVWSAWLPVHTPDVKLIPGLDFDPYSAVTGFDSLADDLAGYQEWLGTSVRELIEQAEAQAVLTAGQEFANSLQFDQLRRSLTTTLGQLDAQFQEVITTAILPLNGQLVALADAITEVSAGDGADTSTARFRMTAMSGPAGYARVAAEARTDGSDVYRSAGWYLDVPNDTEDPTRFMVAADQFVVTNDAEDITHPLVFENGVLTMTAQRVQTITAGRLQNEANTSYFDLNTGAFRVSTQ